VKVLSWNIWWKFEDYLNRQTLIFNELTKAKPDILCLQEVWEDKDGSQAKKIADLFGYDYCYTKSFDFDEVSFGNAIISKYPINNYSSYLIPTEKEFNENRTLLHAEVMYENNKMNIFCTHLNYKYDQSDIRKKQVTYILEHMSKLDKTEFPSILCGDFNADPNSDEIRLILGLSSPINRTVLRDSWQLVNPDNHGYTWSNENNFARKTLEPNRRIDYIFVGAPGKNGLGHPLESCLIGNVEKDGLYPSDHFGIMTHFEG
jgi:endonuclease/exonuclease/phosphatase family metal-dependent hydrolase